MIGADMFSIKDGRIYGYDDNQEALYEQRLKEGHEAISREEALHILNGGADVMKKYKRLMIGIDSVFHKRVRMLSEMYQAEERETWPIQVAEASAYQKSSVHAETPMLDGIAHIRAISLEDLVGRVTQKDTDYRKKVGVLLGAKQRHQDNLEAILQMNPDAIIGELDAYDTKQYWDGEDGYLTPGELSQGTGEK